MSRVQWSFLYSMLWKSRERELGKFHYSNFFPSFWSLSQVEKYLKRSPKIIRNYVVKKPSQKNIKDQIHCAVVLFPLPTLILISLELSYSSPWSSVFMYLEKEGDISVFSFFYYYFLHAEFQHDLFSFQLRSKWMCHRKADPTVFVMSCPFFPSLQARHWCLG